MQQHLRHGKGCRTSPGFPILSSHPFHHYVLLVLMWLTKLVTNPILINLGLNEKKG